MSEVFVPRGPQLEGIQFLVKNSFAALFWDPGRGKTITVLEAYQILRDAGYVRNMIVLSSLNIVEDVWPEQIEKFSDLDMTYSIVAGGSEKKRMAAWDLEADVYLVNNENLFWLTETYGKDLGIDMLVVDESSKYRNGKLRARRRKKKSRQKDRNAFRALVKTLSGYKRRYILTGTPIPKSYLNLWPQMYIVDRGASLGTTLTGYRNNYFNPVGYMGYDWVIREGAEEEIAKAVAPRVHRAERDNSAAIEFFDLEVKIPGKAMEAYKELEEEFITEYRKKILLAKNAAVATGKLRQAANGAVYHDREHNWTAVHTKKVEALSELVDELQGRPLLVVYEFEHDYEMMARHWRRHRYNTEIPQYSGTRDTRKKLKNKWDAGELTVLAAQIQSVSHGLNLQYGGCDILFYGLTFNLDDYEQAYQRLWRDGQKNTVIVYNLVARDTVDEVMAAVLARRSETQRNLLKSLSTDDVMRELTDKYDIKTGYPRQRRG